MFPSFEVAKEQTKPILLQELEETLRKLKSRENEIENRNLEIELISSRLRTAEEELLNMVRDQF